MDIDEELFQMRARLEVQINRGYMAALATLYDVSPQTILIRYAVGFYQ